MTLAPSLSVYLLVCLFILNYTVIHFTCVEHCNFHLLIAFDFAIIGGTNATFYRLILQLMLSQIIPSFG
jgi:hypothetical protein